MKPCFVDLVVGGDFRFGEGAVVDAQGVVLTDGAGCEGVDEEVCGSWRVLKSTACVELPIFVEECPERGVVTLLNDNNVSVSGAWCRSRAMRHYVCKAAEFLENEHCGDVMCHQGNVRRAVLIGRIGQPVEPCCGERFNEADDFDCELAA